MARAFSGEKLSKIDRKNLFVFSDRALVVNQHQHAPAKVVTNSEHA